MVRGLLILTVTVLSILFDFTFGKKLDFPGKIFPAQKIGFSQVDRELVEWASDCAWAIFLKYKY